MATAHAVCSAEIDAIRELFSEIPSVASIFVNQHYDTFFVTIVLPEKDYETEDRIFDLELQLMDTFPNSLFDLNVIALSGRKLTDVVTPSGQVVFYRAA
jgi:hypothetical protein